MRALRIAPPAQLTLLGDERRAEAAVIWSGFPEPTRSTVLTLLARLIRASSIEVEVEAGEVSG